MVSAVENQSAVTVECCGLVQCLLAFRKVVRSFNCHYLDGQFLAPQKVRSSADGGSRFESW